MFGLFRKPAPVIIERQTAVPRVARRSYAAAGSPARFADFAASSTSADYELMNSIARLRNRARNLARNSSTMKRYLQLLKDNVVGPEGFHLRVRVRKQNGDFDSTLNKRIQDRFWKWSQSPSVCGTIDDVELSELAIVSLRRDGEFFCELVRGRGLDGLQINPFEADLVDETLNTVYPPTGNQIKMGVEVTSENRPVAYHLLTQHPGDPGWYWVGGKNGRNRYRRVTADRIIHLMANRDRAGQTRGEPPAAAVAFEIKMLDGYREAEVTGRRIAASTMGFFTKTVNSPSTQIEAMADSHDDELDEFHVELEPGTFKQLPEGYEFQKFDATGSSVDYKQFEQQIKRSVSMGLGISAFTLCMETDGVSYSTARTVVIEDRDFYRGQQRIISKLWRRIFTEWVMQSSLQIDSPIPPSRIGAVLDSFVFRARGWDWVDPARDVNANAEAVRTRQTSLSRVAAQRGIDFDDLLDEIEADEQALRKRGLTSVLPENPIAADETPPDTEDKQNGDQ